jgi:hypothetical protein
MLTTTSACSVIAVIENASKGGLMPNVSAQDVGERLGSMNKWREHELPVYDQKRIASTPPIYIYNVSPIHRWERFQGQLGTVTIMAKPDNVRVSPPCIVMGVIARRYDKGLNRKEWMLEPGLDIAEDIVGCSSTYPVDSPHNNLVNYGCFITTTPIFKLRKEEKDNILSRAASYLKRVSAEEREQILEDLEKTISAEMAPKERDPILVAAELRLDKKLREIVLEADQLHPQNPLFVGKIHRDALSALNEITDSKESRPWAPILTTGRKVSCQWCGTLNKTGVALCSNCHNPIDEELHAQLKKKFSKAD